MEQTESTFEWIFCYNSTAVLEMTNKHSRQLSYKYKITKQSVEDTNEKGNHTLCMITSREL